MTEPKEQRRVTHPYLPPPPDSAESLEVPRMDPPPSSLQAMIQSRPGAALVPPRSRVPWLVLGLLLLLVALAYYFGLRH